jgi:hypothetical protein
MVPESRWRVRTGTKSGFVYTPELCTEKRSLVGRSAWPPLRALERAAVSGQIGWYRGKNPSLLGDGLFLSVRLRRKNNEN